MTGSGIAEIFFIDDTRIKWNKSYNRKEQEQTFSSGSLCICGLDGSCHTALYSGRYPPVWRRGPVSHTFRAESKRWFLYSTCLCHTTARAARPFCPGLLLPHSTRDHRTGRAQQPAFWAIPACARHVPLPRTSAAVTVLLMCRFGRSEWSFTWRACSLLLTWLLEVQQFLVFSPLLWRTWKWLLVSHHFPGTLFWVLFHAVSWRQPLLPWCSSASSHENFEGPPIPVNDVLQVASFRCYSLKTTSSPKSAYILENVLLLWIASFSQYLPLTF